MGALRLGREVEPRLVLEVDRVAAPGTGPGPGSVGSPATQIVRSLELGGSLIPLTRFQAKERPSRAVPTPADHFQDV